MRHRDFSETLLIAEVIVFLQFVSLPATDEYFRHLVEYNQQNHRTCSAIGDLPSFMRLAAEMAAHEESERIAMAGELAQLEDDWREAEEIASIADNLFLPAAVTDFIDRHRPRTRN